MGIIKSIKQNWVYFLIFIVSVFLYFFVIYPSISTNLLMYDTAYQYFLTNKSFGEMMRLIPLDYSPAFYSIFLKGFSLIFGNTLNQMRLSSFIVYLGIILVCIFPLRRALGDKVAIISSICLALSSISYELYIQIRPQVLGYLFVTAASVYAYLIYKTGLKKDYILFTIFSILAMNTHNVAMFAMFSYYVMFLIIFLFLKRYTEIKKLIFSGIVCAITYIPSLIIIIQQFNNVRNNYWSNDDVYAERILNSTLMINFEIGMFVATLISAVFMYIIVFGILIIVGKLVLDKIKKQELNTNALDNLVLILMYLTPMVFFCFIVKFVVPIIQERYLYMFSALPIIILIAFITKFDKKNILIVSISIGFVVNFIFATLNYRSYVKSADLPQKIEEIKMKYGDNVVFVHSHEWSVGVMKYYFPDARHYITDETYTVLNTFDVFSTETEVINIGNPENIINYEDDFITFGKFFPGSQWNPYDYYSEYDYYRVERDDTSYTGSDDSNLPIFVYVEFINE